MNEQLEQIKYQLDKALALEGVTHTEIKGNVLRTNDGDFDTKKITYTIFIK